MDILARRNTSDRLPPEMEKNHTIGSTLNNATTQSGAFHGPLFWAIAKCDLVRMGRGKDVPNATGMGNPKLGLPRYKPMSSDSNKDRPHDTEILSSIGLRS